MEKIGRNDPCPCGSGKKYKQCCLSKSKTYDLRPFYSQWLAIFLIWFLGILIYSNSFHCTFHLDDTPSIVDNFFIRNIHHLKAVWNFLPRRFLLYLSIALNYHFNRLHVAGYHIFNLCVHLICSVLVWWLVRLTFATPVMKDNELARNKGLFALFAGLVFVSHPVQTEAVTYIVQRDASMATLFYVASLCLYVKSRLARSGYYYTGAILTAVLAMFTKETAITLPLMVLLYEFCFFRTNKFNWKYSFPFLFTILIIPITMLLTETPLAQQMRGVTPDSPADISSMHYLLTQFRVVVTYIRLLFLPVHQNLDYDYPVFKSIFEPPVLISFLVLVSILVCALKLFARYRLLSFSIFWFFLTLLPESSILPIKDVIFEHRLYLPMVGYGLFLPVAVYYLLGRNLKIAAMVVTVVIGVDAFLTYQRNEVWQNDFVLWSDTLEKSPHKARPYNNIGYLYDMQGDGEKALWNYNKAIELDPKMAEAYYNRGLLFYNQDKITASIADYDKAIALFPDYTRAYVNRGNAYGRQGNLDEALKDYNKAITIDPHSFLAFNNRGNIYTIKGDNAQALDNYNKAIAINPSFAEAYNDRARTYFFQGNLQASLADSTKAIAVNHRFAVAYANRAITYYHLQEYDEAWADVRQAQALGASVDPQLLNALKKVGGVQAGNQELTAL